MKREGYVVHVGAETLASVEHEICIKSKDCAVACLGREGDFVNLRM